MMRDGLRSFLQERKDMEVLPEEASNGREAVSIAKNKLPDVVVIDIGMPELNGIEAAKKIVALDKKIKVIALSMYSDPHYVSGMIDAGASGYLLKTCDSEELIAAIQAVIKGNVYIAPEIAGVIVGRYRQRGQVEVKASDVLTNKEREVLQLIAEGFTTKQIGAKLGIAFKTVDTHRSHIMGKLDLHSIADLTRYAIRQGITQA